MANPARTRRIEIRLTDEEHSLGEAAAAALGVTLTEFYRRAARASAKDVLAERSRIVLNDDETARFLGALEHPQRFEAGLAWLADPPSVLPRGLSGWGRGGGTFGQSKPRVNWLALHCQDTEDAFVDSVERLSSHESLKRFSA